MGLGDLGCNDSAREIQTACTNLKLSETRSTKSGRNKVVNSGGGEQVVCGSVERFAIVNMTTTRLWNALRLYEYRKLCIMKRTCISPFSDSLTMPSKNFASSTHGTDSEDKVVITDNASVIVCWHPEKPFPYEFSRPLPEIEEADDSVLRVSKDVAARAIMKRKTDEQVRQELMKITHTTKHKWFPKNETRKRIQIHDREYL